MDEELAQLVDGGMAHLVDHSYDDSEHEAYFSHHQDISFAANSVKMVFNVSLGFEQYSEASLFSYVPEAKKRWVGCLEEKI